MKFKAGDIIRVYSEVNCKEYITAVKYARDNEVEDVAGRLWFLNYSLHKIELYEPKAGDICIFWNNHSKAYRISKFKQVAYGKNKEGLFKDMQGNYFENCVPYITQTLDELIEKLNA